MSVVGEIVGIIACVAAVVSAYQDGGTIIGKIKVRRAHKRAAPPSRLLEESIDQAPTDIVREKDRGVSRFGRAFEEGDHIAVIALQSITIQLQSSLLEELRNAVFDDEVTDFRWLVDVADSGRDRTVDTLIQLRQRLLIVEPINEISPVTSHSASMPNIMYGSTQLSPTQSPTSPQLPRHETARHPQVSNHEYNNSRDASGEEDSVSGAEGHRHRKRHSSILGFLRHHHRSSSHDKPREELASHAEDPRRSSQATSPVSGANRPPMSSGRSGGSGHSGQMQWRYQDWEDNPAEIWSTEYQPEHRDSAITITSPSPAPSATNVRHLPNTSPSARHQSLAVPTPTPENAYLGFCKGAVRLQNGDRKALEKRKEFNDGWSQSSVNFLACCSSKCAFAGHLNIDTIWEKVWPDEKRGLKFRWQFLAKSHVMQKTIKDHQYAFQCIFCVYAGEKSPVYHGTDCYLDHVAEHRVYMPEVLLYKAQCVNDHVCDDEEEFDINIFPFAPENPQERKASVMLADELMGLELSSKKESTANDSRTSSNEPWNEGLSDFKYGGVPELAELE